MPPFVLIIILMFVGTWLTQLFVLNPLEFVRNLSIPSWLTLAVLVLVLSWCFGE